MELKTDKVNDTFCETASAVHPKGGVVYLTRAYKLDKNGSVRESALYVQRDKGDGKDPDFLYNSKWVKSPFLKEEKPINKGG